MSERESDRSDQDLLRSAPKDVLRQPHVEAPTTSGDLKVNRPGTGANSSAPKASWKNSTARHRSMTPDDKAEEHGPLKSDNPRLRLRPEKS